MAELRIDPVSGLRTILADGDGDGGTGSGDPLSEGRGQPDLFAIRPDTGTAESLDGSFADPDATAETMERWRAAMREHGEAAYLHLTADGTGAATLHALSFVPAAVARERERCTAYRDRTQGRDLVADLLQEEVRRRERLVAVGPEAVAICPFASRAPFHVQLIPRTPRTRFEDDGPLGAATLHEVLGRLAAVHGEAPGLVLWVRTAPPGAPSFCWRIDVLPVTGAPDALEQGAGVTRCELAPERAAAQLRDATG